MAWRLAVDPKAPLNIIKPKVGRCPACAKDVREGDQFVLLHGDPIHAACGLYRPRAAHDDQRLAKA